MSKSEVSIQIPDDLIKNLVLTEMVKALGNKEQMIEAVVKSAFSAQDRNSYGRETIFEAEVKKSINDAAIEAFRQWLAENKEKVKAAVLRELDKRKKHFADQLATALLDGRFQVKPSISVEIGNLKDY